MTEIKLTIERYDSKRLFSLSILMPNVRFGCEMSFRRVAHLLHILGMDLRGEPFRTDDDNNLSSEDGPLMDIDTWEDGTYQITIGRFWFRLTKADANLLLDELNRVLKCA